MPENRTPYQVHKIHVRKTARYHTLGNTKTPRRIWFVFHGYGHLAAEFLEEFRPFAGENLFVAPEGLSLFYRDRSYTEVGASWLTRELREDGISEQSAFLDAVLNEVYGQVNRGHRPGVSLLGFSQGVSTAARWIQNGTVKTTRLVAWAGKIPEECTASPVSCPLTGIKVDLVRGSRDLLINPDVYQNETQRLRTAGVSFSEHTFEGGHRLDTKLLGRVLAVYP